MATESEFCGLSIDQSLLGADGYLNEAGQDILVAYLDRLNPKRWGKAFVPLKKLDPSVAIELVIVRDRKVLLTLRDDKNFGKGWHTPGSYMETGEEWQDAAQRCANREIKAKVRVVDVITAKNHTDSPRFHDVSVLLLCEIEGEPKTGQWFSECPPDLIQVHQKFWPHIAKHLSSGQK